MLAAITVPLIVCGVWNPVKDAEVMRKVAEVCEGKNAVLCPIEDKNYKPLGAAAIASGSIATASSPIDVNLAKQLNTLLGNLGVKESKIIMDPTTGGLGYGLEYTFSVMERIRMAALVQQDDKMGPAEERAIAIEAVTAVVLLTAGSDILVMRHPRAIAQVMEIIAELS